jgi:hypothetical protein
VGGFDVVDERFRALYERAVLVLEADPRVRRVEVGGSVAAGTADEWSDLDLQVITEPEHHDAFVADWPTWLAEVTPTVFARTPILPFIVNAVTADGLTLDLSIWPGEAPVFPAPPVEYSVGMLSGTRFSELGSALEYAVAEQLRGLAGPFVSLLQREEHLKHLAGVPHLLGLLTTVLLAETGAVPPGKRWNGAYTDEQLAAVAALPPVRATRDDLVAFGLGLAELVVTRARPLFDRYALPWPSDLAAVVAQRLQDELGLDAGTWLY